MNKLRPELETKPGSLIYTDLDGTLLDQETYSSVEAGPALREVLNRKIPVIISSSKTRAEITAIQEELDLLAHPFVVENGGAVYIPVTDHSVSLPGSARRGRFEVLEFGAPYDHLSKMLDKLSAELEIPLRGFHHMDDEQIARECSLSLEAARRAKQREYDEPFILGSIQPGAEARLRECVGQLGLRLVHGGRFFHLLGEHDKGDAIELLTSAYRRKYGSIRSYGIGNSENDLAMLQAADVGIIVQKPDGTYDKVLTESLPGALRAQGVGPKGWSAAVRKILALEKPAPQRKFRLE